MAITKTKRPALGGPSGYLTRFVCCLFQKKSEAASPPDETASQVWDLQMSRRPSSPHWRDDQIPIANCVLARADYGRLIELLGLLQIGHCPTFICSSTANFPGGRLIWCRSQINDDSSHVVPSAIVGTGEARPRMNRRVSFHFSVHFAAFQRYVP